MNEEWRPVAGQEGIYEVSSLGRLRRVKGGTRGSGMLRGFEIKTGAGYLGFKFNDPSRACRRRTVYIHRLVAEAFIGPCPEGCEVNHKDANSKNNAVTNLEYVTHKRNVEHACDLGLHPKGERNGQSVLTEEQAKFAIENRGKIAHRKIAAMFGVSSGAIYSAQRGFSWRYLHD